MSIKYIDFFPNGAAIAFNLDGQQIGSKTYSWFNLYLEYLDKQGIDPTTITFTMPNNKKRK